MLRNIKITKNKHLKYVYLFVFGATAPGEPGPPHWWGF